MVFKTNLSTESATYDLINTILTATNNKLVMGGLFCNLTKAFDCVNHKILLAKLEFYGFNGIAGKLIKTYSMDRQQRTVLNRNTASGVSEWQNVRVSLRVLFWGHCSF
jgi:hypothetical protein